MSITMTARRLKHTAAVSMLIALCNAGCGSGSDGGPARRAVPVVSAGQTLPGYMYVVTAKTLVAPGALIQYSVDRLGVLTPLTPATVPTGINPRAIAADPSGHFLYVVNAGDHSLSQFAIGVGGGLAPLTPAAVSNPGVYSSGIGPNGVTVDPSGRNLYVANLGDGTVAQFSIGADGSLRALTPATVAAGESPMSIAVDPSGQYAYAANFGSYTGPAAGTVTQYQLGSDGALHPLAPFTVAAGDHPVALSFSPDGANAYVLSNCNGTQCIGALTPFKLGAGGALSVSGSVIGTGGHYDALGMVFDQTAASVYLLTNFMGIDVSLATLWPFTVGQNGALTPENPPMIELAPQSAIAQSLVEHSLFILGWQTGLFPVPNSGHVNRYTIEAGKVPVLAESTAIAADFPSSMIYVSAP